MDRDALRNRYVPFDPAWSVSPQAQRPARLLVVGARRGRYSACPGNADGTAHVEHPLYPGTCALCGHKVLF